MSRSLLVYPGTQIQQKYGCVDPRTTYLFATLMPGRRRQGKCRLNTEFAVFQSSSGLFQLAYFVKCTRALLELNSQEPYLSQETKRKFCGCLFTSSIITRKLLEIRRFHVLVVQTKLRPERPKNIFLIPPPLPLSWGLDDRAPAYIPQLKKPT